MQSAYTRCGARRYWPARARYQARFDQLANLARAGYVGRHAAAPGGRRSPSPRRSSRVAIGARGRAGGAGPPPSSVTRSASSALLGARAPARAPSSAAGSASAASRARAGSIVALVSACGIRSIAHERLADDVVEANAPSRARRRRGSSRARARRGSRSARVGVERLGDQLRAAQRRQLGDRVGERRVERVGAVGERVHRARPQPLLGQADHQRRIGEHDRGAHQPARPPPRGRSGSRWIRVISAPERVVGSAATRPPLTAAIAFATSITRPPPSATRSRSPTSSIEPRGDLVHRARRHVVEAGRRPRRARPAPRPSPARWSAARRPRTRARRGCRATRRRPRRGSGSSARRRAR